MRGDIGAVERAERRVQCPSAGKGNGTGLVISMATDATCSLGNIHTPRDIGTLGMGRASKDRQRGEQRQPGKEEICQALHTLFGPGGYAQRPQWQESGSAVKIVAIAPEV